MRLNVLSRYLICISIWFIGAMGLWAQDALEEDSYQDWETFATRAEMVVGDDSSSDRALEILREDLVGWRETFTEGKSVNAERIATVRAQIDALGPVPEEAQEDESESEDITARREQLAEALAVLVAPVARADEAYIRADGLIGEIDGELRSRTSNQLFSPGSSPLNPANWIAAYQSLEKSISALSSEVQNQGGRAWNLQTQLERLPFVVPLLAIGIISLLKSRGWVDWMVVKLRSNMRPGTGVFRLMASLLMILLPYLGIVALCEAAKQSGFLGYRTHTLIALLPGLALRLLFIRWLAELAFHKDASQAMLPLPTKYRREARMYAMVLAVIFVLRDLLSWLAQFDNYSTESIAVLQFPLLVFAGLQLFFLGRVRRTLRRAPKRDSEDGVEADEPRAFRLRIVRGGARAASFAGIVGPIVAALGYFDLGSLLVYSTIASLALITAVYIGQQAIHMLFHLLTGKKPDESQSLIPVLLSIFLAICAVPVLALLWGARRSDLTEIWSRFLEGFQVGDTTISPTDFLMVALVFLIGYLVTRLVQGTLRNSVLPRTKLDAGGKNAVLSGTGYLGIGLAAMIAVSAGGLDLSSLALVAGALSVGIGFGLQNIIQNFVSGIILLIERPISEGDWIEVGGVHGIVQDISVRSTRIQTFDRTDVIVPNGDFVSGTVTNYTRGNVLGRIIVPVGVAYGTDTRKVEKILLGIARAHPLVLMNPAPYIVFTGFGADSMDFEIRVVLVDVNKGLSVRTEINHQIAERFAEENIEIPFAQRDIWLRNPEALGAVQAPPEQELDHAQRELPGVNPIPRDKDIDVESDFADGDGGGDGGPR